MASREAVPEGEESEGLDFEDGPESFEPEDDDVMHGIEIQRRRTLQQQLQQSSQQKLPVHLALRSLRPLTFRRHHQTNRPCYTP